jgi:hypothetical protein
MGPSFLNLSRTPRGFSAPVAATCRPRQNLGPGPTPVGFAPLQHSSVQAVLPFAPCYPFRITVGKSRGVDYLSTRRHPGFGYPSDAPSSPELRNPISGPSVLGVHPFRVLLHPRGVPSFRPGSSSPAVCNSFRVFPFVIGRAHSQMGFKHSREPFLS